jgi:hypothetical protein
VKQGQNDEMSQIDLIRRLIATHTKKRDGLLVDLRKIESGEIRLGTTEVGAKNGDISQQWIRQLKIWIADLNYLLTDLNGFLLGTRSSI